MADHEDALEGLVDCSEDGVDLALIRWSLSLSPTERLANLQRTLESIQAIRDQNAVPEVDQNPTGQAPQNEDMQEGRAFCDPS